MTLCGWLGAEASLAFVLEPFATDARRSRPCEERGAEMVAHWQAESRPVLDRFTAWIDQETPKLLSGQQLRPALGYARSHWTALQRNCVDGRLDIDDNEVKRTIRGIAVGRRNGLFCGSDRGGRAAAALYSA